MHFCSLITTHFFTIEVAKTPRSRLVKNGDLVWCLGSVLCDLVWCVMISYGVHNDLVWCVMISCGVYDLVWCAIIS